MSMRVTDLGLLLRVAILEAIQCSFSSPCSIAFCHYRDATQPSSEHLGSFSSCFRSSVVSAAAVAVTPASNKVCGLSGDVTDTSKAAVLPMTCI